MSVIRKTLRTNIQMSEELNKIDECLYQILMFFARILKIKKQVD